MPLFLHAEAAGLQGRQAGLIASSVQYALGVAFTIPTVFLIDRLGRRPLMFGGAVSMATCLIIVGSLTAGFGHAVPGAGSATTVTWVVEGHPAVRNAIIGAWPTGGDEGPESLLTRSAPHSLLVPLRLLVRLVSLSFGGVRQGEVRY